MALSYADATICASGDVVAAAMKKDWEVVRFASVELCKERDFVLDAVAPHDHVALERPVTADDSPAACGVPLSVLWEHPTSLVADVQERRPATKA